MGKVVSALTGGLLGGAKPPTVSEKASDSVKSDAQDAKKARARLLETQGGASGEEINPENVGKRPTLLGN